MTLIQGELNAPNQKNVSKIVDFIIEYESVFRFSRNRLIFPENLVSHIGTVTILGCYLMDTINDMWLAEGDEKEKFKREYLFSSNDYKLFMRRAVVHDMDEIVTGDIARPTKYANADILKHLKILEEKSVGQIVEEFELPLIWKAEWRIAKSDVVGLVVKVTDLLSVIVTCHREYGLYGNNQFRKVIQEATEFISEFSDIIKAKRDGIDDNVGDKFILDKLIYFVDSATEVAKRRYT
jgi:5'-deoxynucleotidase YfbR-like HD superfamily hydrolase